jgi:glycosyltransferase involved in cell wall biosynthesis
LVNDGSSDGSDTICDKYAAADSRVHVIHKQNGGVSTARNAGLDAMTGNFFAFIDSDDTAEPNMYEELLQKHRESGADIVICGYNMICDGYTRKMQMPIDDTISRSEYFEQLLTHHGDMLLCTIWNKLHLATPGLSKLRFIEGMNNTEDSFYSIECYSKAEKLAFCEELLYNYVNIGNTGSLSKSNFYDIRVKFNEYLRGVLKRELPGREAEADRVMDCQDEVIKTKLIHRAYTNNFPKPFPLRFRSVRTILRLSTDYREKLSALMIYFLPRRLYLAAFRIFASRIEGN